jgi:uncharacterized protein YkwD
MVVLTPRLSGACVLAVAMAGCGSTTPAGPSDVPRAAVPDTPIASALIDLTNTERSRAGLATLRPEPRLMHAAQLQADQNARFGRLDHVLPEAPYPRPQDRLAAAGYPWQASGENLAFGYPDASSVVTGWMNSSGHRANILNGTFTEIGVGYALDSARQPYYAQVFGRPR